MVPPPPSRKITNLGSGWSNFSVYTMLFSFVKPLKLLVFVLWKTTTTRMGKEFLQLRHKLMTEDDFFTQCTYTTHTYRHIQSKATFCCVFAGQKNLHQRFKRFQRVCVPKLRKPVNPPHTQDLTFINSTRQKKMKAIFKKHGPTISPHLH